MGKTFRFTDNYSIVLSSILLKGAGFEVWGLLSYWCSGSGRDSEMTIADVHELVQYVTNAQGKTIGVLVPLEVWEDLLKSWQALANELGQVDEAEPNEQILADLKDSLRQVKAGQTFPIAELWDGIDV